MMISQSVEATAAHASIACSLNVRAICSRAILHAWTQSGRSITLYNVTSHSCFTPFLLLNAARDVTTAKTNLQCKT